MADVKTKQTGASVQAFLKRVADEPKRQDCQTLLRIMKKATGAEPRMWGTSIVGFGDYHYKYDSGREGDWFLAGFSPRKQDLTVYLMGGLDRNEAQLARLGKHKRSKGCLYIKRLADVDLAILEKLVSASVKQKKPSPRSSQ